VSGGRTAGPLSLSLSLSLTALAPHRTVMRRIAQCVESAHFQVAERTLRLWDNEHVLYLFDTCVETVLPTLFAPLYRNSRSHWSKTIQSALERCGGRRGAPPPTSLTTD
jgi:hypothetical protein